MRRRWLRLARARRILRTVRSRYQIFPSARSCTRREGLLRRLIVALRVIALSATPWTPTENMTRARISTNARASRIARQRYPPGARGHGIGGVYVTRWAGKEDAWPRRPQQARSVGIGVVCSDGSPFGARRAAFREVICKTLVFDLAAWLPGAGGGVSTVVMLLDVAFALGNTERVTVHDLVAQKRVIQTKRVIG